MVLGFRYPLEPCPRVWIVQPPFHCGPLHLRGFETVAAPVSLLLDLPANAWQPTYPLVAFTGARWGFLTDRDRDILWRRWRIPVYEQLLSDTADVIAEECDAHDGLHLRDTSAPLDGVDADVVTRRCECGLTTPRLLNVRPLRRANAACA